MINWIKIGIALIIVGVIGGFVVYKFVYNKAHTDFEKAKAEYSLPAKDIFDAYRADAAAAGEKYNGRVIEVSGTLSDIEELEETVTAVFVFDEGMFGPEGVRVTMLSNHRDALKNHPKGKTIRLKGFNAGYNESDVILASGSVVK
jgi:hypothetical protein